MGKTSQARSMNRKPLSLIFGPSAFYPGGRNGVFCRYPYHGPGAQLLNVEGRWRQGVSKANNNLKKQVDDALAALVAQKTAEIEALKALLKTQKADDELAFEERQEAMVQSLTASLAPNAVGITQGHRKIAPQTRKKFQKLVDHTQLNHIIKLYH